MTAKFTSDFTINPVLLEEEVIRQSELIYKYSMMLPKKKMVIEELRNELELIMLKVRADIYKNPQNYKDIAGPKILEKQVDLLTNHNFEIQNKKIEIRKAEAQKAEVEAALRSLDHKKYALQDLVRMRGWEKYSETII